jgi:neuralized-like protein 4
MFYVNGQSQGVAAVGLPLQLYAVVDMYGKCAQVSIIQPEQSSTITDSKFFLIKIEMCLNCNTTLMQNIFNVFTC